MGGCQQMANMEKLCLPWFERFEKSAGYGEADAGCPAEYSEVQSRFGLGADRELQVRFVGLEDESGSAAEYAD